MTTSPPSQFLIILIFHSSARHCSSEKQMPRPPSAFVSPPRAPKTIYDRVPAVSARNVHTTTTNVRPDHMWLYDEPLPHRVPRAPTPRRVIGSELRTDILGFFS